MCRQAGVAVRCELCGRPDLHLPLAKCPAEHLPVQTPVLDSFGDVVFGDGVLGVEAGQGTGDAEDFVVGAGAKPELVVSSPSAFASSQGMSWNEAPSLLSADSTAPAEDVLAKV